MPVPLASPPIRYPQRVAVAVEALVDLGQLAGPVVELFGFHASCVQVDSPAPERAAGQVEEQCDILALETIDVQRERWAFEDRGFQGQRVAVDVGGQRMHDVLRFDFRCDPTDLAVFDIVARYQRQHGRQLRMPSLHRLPAFDAVRVEDETLKRQHHPVRGQPHVVHFRGIRRVPEFSGCDRAVGLHDMDGDVRLVIAVGPAIQRAAGAVPFRVRGECRIAVAGLIEDPAGQLRRPPDHTAGLLGDGIQGHRRAALLARCEAISPRPESGLMLLVPCGIPRVCSLGAAAAPKAMLRQSVQSPSVQQNIQPLMSIFQLILGRANPAPGYGSRRSRCRTSGPELYRPSPVSPLQRPASDRSLERRPDPIEAAGKLSGDFTERRYAVLDGRLEPHRSEGSGQHGGIRHIHHGNSVY